MFDEDVVEDLEDDEEEKETREELINSIVGQVATTHPILYDSYNLCELQANDWISVFKVKMLKDICKHLELKISSKEKKIALVNTIRNFVKKCSCC